jgi:hypothetical protein
MKLFFSHSNRDAEWVHAVNAQLEKLGIAVYLAELDLQPGQPLDQKIQKRIDESDAMIVLLTERAALSPIVREEIGYAIRARKLVVPLVDHAVAKDPSLMGMLNGHEYILFDKDQPQEGLLTLAQWAQAQVHREQQSIIRQQLHRAQLDAEHESNARKQAELQLALQTREVMQLQSTNQALMVLLVFALVVGGIAMIGSATQ